MPLRLRDPHAGRLNRYPKGGVPIDERLRALPPHTNTSGCPSGCHCDACDPFNYTADGSYVGRRGA